LAWWFLTRKRETAVYHIDIGIADNYNGDNPDGRYKNRN
jgi:hypothetical protein